MRIRVMKMMMVECPQGFTERVMRKIKNIEKRKNKKNEENNHK